MVIKDKIYNYENVDEVNLTRVNKGTGTFETNQGAMPFKPIVKGQRGKNVFTSKVRGQNQLKCPKWLLIQQTYRPTPPQNVTSFNKNSARHITKIPLRFQ